MAQKIILHIGPEKCGSTTLQRALTAADGPFATQLRAVVLDPYAVHALDRAAPEPTWVAYFDTLIRTELAAATGKPLVLSHEMIFKSAHILRALACTAQQHAAEICGVAILRRQADFLLSAYGQWHFRSPARLCEIADTLRAHALVPEHFLGVERFLIACLLGGWEVGRQPSGHLYLDWDRSVQSCAETLRPLAGTLSLGLLPRSGFDTSLVAQFGALVGVQGAQPRAPETIANRSFPPALIEAVSNAIDLRLEMPGPHEANDFFAGAHDMTLTPLPKSDFLTLLCSAVDSAFWPANQRLAARWSLPAAYFAPETDLDLESATRAIFDEARRRAAQPARTWHQARAARAAEAQAAWHGYQSRTARNRR